MAKVFLEVDERDWDDFCIIMKDLTWGKGEMMDRWHALRERIEKKKLFKVEECDTSSQ
jgi:hypothetical protein